MILSTFSLQGKTALVTGSSRGIGAAIARAMAEAGADIIGVASRDVGSESNGATYITSLGRRYWGFEADLSDRAAVYQLVDRVHALQIPIDILVNNAGAIYRQPIVEHDDQAWDQVLDINLHAPFILTKALGKSMLERGSGKVVFTCSLLSFQGGIWVPGYAASKGAIASLLKAFSNEWASKGINVNGVAPGYIATDNTAALRDDEARSAAILQRIPAGRWGQPQDLAGAYVFLASSAANYIHGTILTVDGGWMGR